MKTNKKTHRLMTGMLTAGCAIGMMSALPARAEVSDADFNALKQMVQKLSEQVQQLQQTNQVAQQTHQQDMQQLQQLQEKLEATQKTASDAEQKSIAAAAQVQPLERQPIDEATVNHNFMILGDAEFQFGKTEGQNAGFALADFAPIFLYRGGDNILFEAGFDTTIANNAPGGGGYSTSFDLSFAQLDYVLNDYITLCAGDLLLPLGTYTERGAGWLNKFPDDPLAIDLVPGSGVGAQLRGAIPLGDSGKLFNYSVYGVNGPSSADGTGNASALDLGGNVGPSNLHSKPVGGARLGIFLPLPYKPHYDLELGVSAQSGQWDNAGNHLYSAGVLDATLHLGSYFEARSEYILSRYGSDNQGMVRQQGLWAQVGYKLAGLNLELPVVNNVELVGRYDSLHDGLNAPIRRWTAGYIYYFTNTLLFEGDYEFVHSPDPTQSVDQLLLQLSYGF